MVKDPDEVPAQMIRIVSLVAAAISISGIPTSADSIVDRARKFEKHLNEGKASNDKK